MKNKKEKNADKKSQTDAKVTSSKDTQTEKIKYSNQYVAGIIITLGGFIMGTIIGWSSPAEPTLIEDLKITPKHFAYIASAPAIGAALSQIIVAILMDRIGRKITIVTLSWCSLIGWSMITFAGEYKLIIVGRFFVGLFAGGFCTVCPTFIAEIAHKSRRGCIAGFFHLQMVTGVLFCFSFAFLDNLFIFNLSCFVVPVLAPILLLILVPESPTFLIKKSKEEAARKSLIFYRGNEYDIEPEIEGIKKEIQEESFLKSIRERANLLAFSMLLGLHVIQQLAGINAILSYAHCTFKETHTKVPYKVSVLAMACTQLVVSIIAACFVDRVGRKLMWYMSLSLMGVALVCFGLFSTSQKNNVEFVKQIFFVPTASILLYVIGFCVGCGPLPWGMTGEVLPSHIKYAAGTTATFVNWMLAFTVTILYPTMSDVVGIDVVLYFFASICFLGIIFVLFFVIETKGKSLDEIQSILRSS